MAASASSTCLLRSTRLPSPLPRALPAAVSPSFTLLPTGKRWRLRLTALSTLDLRAAVITKDSWEKSILTSETPVLVEFYASWCGPCRMVHRIIDEIARDYAGKLECFVLNTDNDSLVAEDYEIKTVPVVLLFKNGLKCESIIGTMPKEFYLAAIERVLSS